MRGGKTSWPRIAFVLAVAAGLGSVSALGQSPTTPGSSRVSKAQGAVPIDLPEPRRITVAARPVARGEIAVFDPITVTIAPAHIPPKDLAVFDPARLTVSAGKDVVVIDVPSPPKVVVGVLNQAPKPVLVPEPLRTAAAISRRAPTATPVTEALKLRQVEVGANRDPLPTIEISDPIATAVGANRVPLSVVDAEAAIAACDFEGVRAYLRALVAVSDQLDSDGRKVVAELSRLNRANTAFEAARLRYDDGRLDEANTLLVLAEKTQCEAREKKVEVVLSKIDRLQKAIWKIDEAIMGCNIPAMASLHGQLEGQSHVLLSERRQILERLAEPAAIATEKSGVAAAALVDGRLEQAQGDLSAAEEQLAQFPDEQRCLALRQEIAAPRTEIDRIAGLASRADEAVGACDIDGMTVLSDALATETNVLLAAKKTAIDTLNGPATTARDLAANAIAPFDRGEMDDAQAILRIAEAELAKIENPALCPQVRDNVAIQLAEIDRVRQFAAKAGKDIVACTAPEIASLSKRLVGEENVLLIGRLDIIQQIEDSVVGAQGHLDRSAELYRNGQLDGAEAEANAVLDQLSAIQEITACEPLREQVASRLADIEDLRARLAEADGAVAACDVPSMRRLAAAMEGAEHTLLIAERKRLLDIGQPVTEASDLNQTAEGHYNAGRLDEAELAIRGAAERLAEVESCAPLKELVARRLDRIERMRVVLARVDDAVAACEVPAMTAMAAQLEGQSHVLLAGRLDKVKAVNTPATAALKLRRSGRKAFDAGDLATGQRQYGEAQGQLANIASELCTDMRDDTTAQLARMAEISGTLARVEDAVVACTLPRLREIDGELEGQSYVLLANSRQRVRDMILPLDEAQLAHAQSKALYESGDLADAAASQKTAAKALGRIDGHYCVDLRQQFAATTTQIVRVQKLLAQADKNMIACRTDGADTLAQELASIDHRLLRSKKAEIDAYYRPVNATINLVEAAAEQYFQGNIDAAENRLIQARQELAERPDCSALFERIDRNVGRISTMRRTMNRVDRAIAACSIPAMASMSRQLDGQPHVLLAEKKNGLDRIMVPATTAQRRNAEAWPLFENGQLVAAQTRLDQALDQLDQIAQVDRTLCTPLRREIEARLNEADRVRSTLVIVDAALASCNFADIDLLKANLANAGHVSLKRAFEDLQAGRLRCGLSDDEKLAQAEATCQRKYANSIVDEFDVETGRYNCVCAADYMWDPENAACIAKLDVQEASNQVCASGYPNSVAVNIRGPKQFECNCREGYVWNQDETSCVAADIVVQNAVEACAREDGYPAEIEGAGRFTCCPNGTAWDRSRRECVKADEAAATGGDPQCRWVSSPTGTRDAYLCTCDPEQLCGARPEPTPAMTEAPAALPETTDETPTASAEEPAIALPETSEPVVEADEGVVDKIKKLFGNIF
jgi:hypothetical protein